VPANLDDIRRHFELLSDEALLEANPDDLTEIARQCHAEEVERRGLLAAPEAAEAATENPDAPAAPEADEPITLATYTVYDEANLARGLLQSAGIPCALKSAQATLGVYEILLIVPASMEQDALEVLASDISDEDLAAQAEAEEI
jgi:hypothetical protein